MTTYDVHQHLWPESLVAALAERTSAPLIRDHTLVLEDEGSFEIDPGTYGAEARIASLDRAGVDVAIVSCPPTLGIEKLDVSEAEPLLRAYHEGARAVVDSSGGRILALSIGRPCEGFVGTIVAAGDLEELDRIAPVLDEIERSETFLFVHPGAARASAGMPDWWASAIDYTAQMQRAYAVWLAHGVARWPALRVVFSILAGGAPFQLERMQSRGFDIRNALHPTIYLDASSYGRRALELCLATLGARQILFGSDAPVISPEITISHVRSFGQAATEALCQLNPESLLT